MEIKSTTTPANTPVNSPAVSPVTEQPKAAQATGFSGSHTANPSVTKPADADASKTAPVSPEKKDAAPAEAASSMKR